MLIPLLLSKETHKWCIYMLTSPSGKHYVGQARNYHDRQRHRLSSYNLWVMRGCKYNGDNPHLFKAFKKYGVENFKAEILEENIESQERLDALEIYYIDFYDCIENGYNIAEGGNTVCPVNPETGRGYRYGKSPYFANSTDSTQEYNREYYCKNQSRKLSRGKIYRESHPEKVQFHRAKNQEKENERRRIQSRCMREADKYTFGEKKGDLGFTYRRSFGGGRTRSKGFVAPHGLLTPQGCWIFNIA